MASGIRREDRSGGVFTRRALLLGAGQLGILGALAGKLYQVQVVEGERYATLAETNRISARLTAPTRGRILDRSGVVLAGNRLTAANRETLEACRRQAARTEKAVRCAIEVGVGE